MRIGLIYPGAAFSVRDVAVGYNHALSLLGHDVIPIDMPNRIAWFEKAIQANGTSKDYDSEVSRMAAENAVIECLRNRVDFVLVCCGHWFHPDAYVLFHRAKVPVAMIFTECPYNDSDQIQLAGMVNWAFVNDLWSVEAFRQVRDRTWYLPPAYDPEIHRPIRVPPVYQSDVLFIGTGFSGRVELLEAVDWTGIDFKLMGFWELPEESPLRAYYNNKLVPNEQAVWHYAGAKICLNVHRVDQGWGAEWRDRRITEAFSVNPRAYELAACQVFQLTDDSRPELRALFGDAASTFHSADDLEERIRYYLARPDLRAASIAECATRLDGQTFLDRSRFLIDCVTGRHPVEKEVAHVSA